MSDNVERFETDIHTVHLAISKVFYYQLMHKRIFLKRSIKIYMQTAPICFGVITIIRQHTTEWAKSRYTEVAILYTIYCIPTFGPLCI